MSSKTAMKVVGDFLSDASGKVLAIKGSWGVGKTHFWRKEVAKEARKKDSSISKYSYVSLFGISSIDQIKFAIFENLVDKSQVDSQISIENIKSNADHVAARLGRKLFRLLQGLPYLNEYGTVLQSVAFYSVTDALVCLDDFERKSDSVSAKDILGLVSLLKEQRGCRVVLIFNEGSLNDFSKKEYEEFREKVIDVEVFYEPTPSESASLVFEDSEIGNVLSGHAISLGITNIRILRKIQTTAKELAFFLSGFEDEVSKQAMQSLVVLMWSFYSKSEATPPFGYVKDHRLRLFKDNGPVEDKISRGWSAILNRYGYISSDEFDLEIAGIVERGYINEVSLMNAANELNMQAKANRSRESFQGAWDLLHNSFEDLTEEIVRRLQEAPATAMKHVGFADLHSSVRLLRELGHDNSASRLIDQYVEANSTNRARFDLKNYPFSGDISDPELVAIFEQKYSELREFVTAEQVLQRVSSKNGWSSSDESVLIAAGKDELKRIFLTTRGKDLVQYIEFCLQFSRSSEDSDPRREIAKSAIAALFEIAETSPLNAIRLRRYGLTVPTNAGDQNVDA